jgi:hypothetical protein
MDAGSNIPIITRTGSIAPTWMPCLLMAASGLLTITTGI